jgi:hypothetical protein
MIFIEKPRPGRILAGTYSPYFPRIDALIRGSLILGFRI